VEAAHRTHTVNSNVGVFYHCEGCFRRAAYLMERSAGVEISETVTAAHGVEELCLGKRSGAVKKANLNRAQIDAAICIFRSVHIFASVNNCARTCRYGGRRLFFAKHRKSG